MSKGVQKEGGDVVGEGEQGEHLDLSFSVHQDVSRPDITCPATQGMAVKSHLTQSIEDVPEFTLLEVLACDGPFIDEFCQGGAVVFIL